MRGTILLVCSNVTLRSCIARVIRSLPLLLIDAATPDEALFSLENQNVDVVFVEKMLPGGGCGLNLLTRIVDRYPTVAGALVVGPHRVETLPRLTGLDSVRVLAIPEEDATVRKMIAECMCLRAAQFIAALQLEPADHCGHAHLDAEHSTETVQGAPASAKVRKLLDLTNDALSRRELEVLDLLLQGDRKTQVARKLHISVFTVRNHVKAIYRKLRVSSHEELLSAAPRDQYALRITAAT